MERTIKVTLTETASKILHSHGIAPENYGPAFSGESAGLDLYNAGPDIVIYGRNKWVAFEEEKVLIPTGVKIVLPHNTVGLLKERSSILGYGLFSRAGVIDPGYSGEIFVNLMSLGERDIKIQTGAKLPVQLVVVPCFSDFKVISNLEYLRKTEGSARKERSLGSTDLSGKDNL